MSANTNTVAVNPLSFSINSVEGSLQILLSGKLLHDYSKKFKMSLQYVVNKGVDRIVVDLSNVNAVDHSISLFLIKSSEDLVNSDRKMAVVYPREPSAREAAEKLKISNKIPCFGSLNEAISFFDQKQIKTIDDVVSAMYEGMNVVLKPTEESSNSAIVLNKYDSTIWLSWPKNREMNLISIADRLQVLFLKCDGIYQFEADVYKKILNPKPAIVIMKPAEVNQAEIRNFYRYDTKMVMQFKKFYDNKPPEKQMLVGVCTNLSAGGVQIESSCTVDKYDYVVIYLQLPGFTLNNMIGKIVRVIPQDKGKYSYGVKFTAIFEIDRLKIENYILEKMNLKGA